MNLKKYLNKADKLELATYKLALTCQISDTQATIDLIDKQIKKIELKDQKQLLYEAIKKDEIKGNSSENILFTGGN
tara:strand:- start:154 stop:381 length:228 start_codon:yes stop_codon:yes gene_type:complete